jgi:ribonuclease HII
VVLDPAHPIEGLRDSKKLSARGRDRLEVQIRAHALGWCVASATAQEIDQINILQASLLAMCRAVEGLSSPVTLALVDGNRAPQLVCEVETIVKGDATEPAISAASILAKCARDRHMLALDLTYPQYGFKSHQGYPTAAHVERLREHGPCLEHRRSFAPVRLAEQGLL